MLLSLESLVPYMMSTVPFRVDFIVIGLNYGDDLAYIEMFHSRLAISCTSRLPFPYRECKRVQILTV